MERAYALRDAREKERLEYVRQCYDMQWRDACDDARALDSAALTHLMSKERMAQIQEKIDRKQKLSVAENDFVEDWKKQLAAVEERERAKEETRRKADSDMEAGLRQQVLHILHIKIIFIAKLLCKSLYRSQMEYNHLRKQEHFQQTRQQDEDELRRVSFFISHPPVLFACVTNEL